MVSIKQKISLVIVIMSAIICFSVSFIMGISSVKIFDRKSTSIFSSVNETLRVKYDITFSSDRQVFPLFPTLLNSIHSNLGLGEYANIHIVAMPDVTPEDYSVLSRLIDELGFSRKLTLMFYPFTYKLKYKQTLKHVSVATMCRLLLPEILDKRIDKILYVDTDAIINHSLRQLFKTEIKSECGVVARSSTNSNIINDWLKKDELFEHLQYKADRSFNAGVLLLSLDKLRENNFVNKTLSLVQKWGINDQIALNFYCNGTYDELLMDYNFWAGRDDWRDSVRHKIVHFAGPSKPWTINYQPYEEQLLWYKYFLSYPDGKKMTPPLKPTYIFLIKYSHSLEDGTLNLPEIVVSNKGCRYMIHILAINFKGKDKENMQNQINNFINQDIWITYNFLNDPNDKNPKESLRQHALFKLPKILHEYVDKTFLAFDKIPNDNYLCQPQKQLGINPEFRSFEQDSDDIFGVDLGLDFGMSYHSYLNSSFVQEMESIGMTTTSTTSSTYSTDNYTALETSPEVNSDRSLWCIEISEQLYYLNLQRLRMERNRFQDSIKDKLTNAEGIFRSECLKIPINSNHIQTRNDHKNTDNFDENIHIQNKLYF
ncbi:Glycosyl transferase-like 8 [Cryptosporidium canis]|nr:Glycosyl transferase-like 8 [Cryptosporidium canis]